MNLSRASRLLLPGSMGVPDGPETMVVVVEDMVGGVMADSQMAG